MKDVMAHDEHPENFRANQRMMALVEFSREVSEFSV
jgi:hypothetical protein